MSLRIQHTFVRAMLAAARCARCEDGQGITEYALILVLVAVVALAALTLLGTRVTRVITTAANSV